MTECSNAIFKRSEEIEKELGYSFKNKNLLFLAFVHRSFLNENRHLMTAHNERLEFLGDSVLGIIISDYLYRCLPNRSEGELSHLRSHIVDAGTCSQFAQKLAVNRYILLGRGEQMNDGKGKETILADFFEALLGAIYLDGGFEAVKAFFFSHFETTLQELINKPFRNSKAALQEFAQKKHQKIPLYQLIEVAGPEHDKLFRIRAMIGEEEVGEGLGSSKKEAEQAAAENALERIAKLALEG
jgi:ribonuclease III